MTAATYRADTLPAPVRDASAWYGPALMAGGEWLRPLDQTEVAEIEAASRALVDRGADLAQVRPADFPLPTLAPRLARLLHDLLERPRLRAAARPAGAALATRTERGRLPGPGQRTWAACGSQNAAGHLLGHVRDVGLAPPTRRCASTRRTSARPSTPTAATSSACCACRPRRSGGLSALVSSTTMYNEMRRRRPDLAALLFEPLATDRRGEVPPGCQALVRDSGVQLVRRPAVDDLPAPVHRFGAALRRGAAADAGAHRGARTCSTRWPTTRR